MHILCVYVTIFIGSLWNYLDHYHPFNQVTDRLGTQASSPPWLNLETKATKSSELISATSSKLGSTQDMEKQTLRCCKIKGATETYGGE